MAAFSGRQHSMAKTVQQKQPNNPRIIEISGANEGIKCCWDNALCPKELGGPYMQELANMPWEVCQEKKRQMGAGASSPTLPQFWRWSDRIDFSISWNILLSRSLCVLLYFPTVNRLSRAVLASGVCLICSHCVPLCVLWLMMLIEYCHYCTQLSLFTPPLQFLIVFIFSNSLPIWP